MKLSTIKWHGVALSFVLASGYGVTAMADDPVGSVTPTNHQMMKDCIERQKTADVTMSKAQMRRICKDELKRQKDTGSMPTPPTDAAKP